MSLFSPPERSFARALSELIHCNPFLPERVRYERDALGSDFKAYEPVWHARADREQPNPNLLLLSARATKLAEEVRVRLHDGEAGGAEDRALYEEVVLYLLYSRYEDRLWQLIEAAGRGTTSEPQIDFYPSFAADAEHFLRLSGLTLLEREPPAHLFASLFQVRRAFHFTFRQIIGGSRPAAELRATVWQSVFTHDMRRYRRSLYARIGDLTTLITGPTGTGKELVASAIGRSRYIPFDPRAQRFAASFTNSLHGLSLSALSPTLIESELFGHKRGAFTGALQDRVGWLEACGELGTVFLDEIGELDTAIQVKLLRVLQSRTFQRLGETKSIVFKGKIIAATNRDLAREMRSGRFREDLFYRLCADVVTTPTLRAQLQDSPGELHNLVLFIARGLVGDEEAEPLAREVEEWVDRRLGAAYTWPGNVRELEQCVRNILVHRQYHPPDEPIHNPRRDLSEAFCQGTLTADELLSRYCTLVYAQTGNYVETARRLGIDRRTVKDRIDQELLAALGGANQKATSDDHD